MSKFSVKPPITVVVTLEGLATSPLGCYGCSWNETPAINTLAAGGVVWDRWTSPIDRTGGLISRWLGESRGVIDRFAQREFETVFVSDDPKLVVPEDNFGFTRRIHTQPMLKRLPAETIDETVMAKTFATAIDAFDAKTALLWLHGSSLRDHWDAPLDDDNGSQEQAAPQEQSEDDEPIELPEPLHLPRTADPPAFELSDSSDPDLLFAWMNRYAAQVRLLDQLLQWLVDSLRRRKPVIVLAGASGFSLGESGWVGHRVGPLRSQDIRLPMLTSVGGPLRVPLLQSAAALPDWLSRLSNRDPLTGVLNEALITPSQWSENVDGEQCAVHTDSDRAVKAVTTSSWFYVQDGADSSGGRRHLFLKPDDVHDVNDVARLRREVVDQFESSAGVPC